MAGATRVTVIGRSLRQIAAVWGGLRSFYSSADLVVAENPVSRALEEPCRDDMAVFALFDDPDDFDALEAIDGAPDWLVILCPLELLQRTRSGLDSAAFAVPVLAVEDAHLALLGRAFFPTPSRDQASHRERL